MASEFLTGLSPGDQLGNLEYQIDAPMLAEYRRLAGESSCYPNLMADDCRTLLRQRCEDIPLTNVWQGFEFFRPPVVGRRIQVGGWLRGIEGDDARPLAMVDSFAVDEIGTEILRAQAVILVGGGGLPTNVMTGSEQSPTPAAGVNDGAGKLVFNAADLKAGDDLPLGHFRLLRGERLAAWETLESGLSGVDRGSDGIAPSGVVASWLEGRLARYFGDDFRWGGRLSVGYTLPVNASEAWYAKGRVEERRADVNGAVSYRISVLVRNQLGQVDATVEARVTAPSPRRL